jgi:hypothetical protein
MTNTEILIEAGKLAAGPNVPPTKVVVRGGTVYLAEDTLFQSGDRIFTYRQEMGSCFLEEEKSSFTAEEWLTSQGFPSIRLITLLDLESKLAAANRTSQKLATVRAWINGILASFVQDSTPKTDWPAAPHTFEETTQEAFELLNQ